MNKPQLVSLFVYRRQSRDRFRMCVNAWERGSRLCAWCMWV